MDEKLWRPGRNTRSNKKVEISEETVDEMKASENEIRKSYNVVEKKRMKTNTWRNEKKKSSNLKKIMNKIQHWER